MHSTRVLVVLHLVVLALAPASGQADKSMLELATEKGCFICHTQEKDKSTKVPLAPSYRDIALRYQKKTDATGYLADRIRQGTAFSEQNWQGSVNMRFMPPNVNVSQNEATDMATWILSLSKKAPEQADTEHEQMLALATNAGCMACHDTRRQADSRYVPLAPALVDIASRYRGDSAAHDKLVDAVLNGTEDNPKSWEDVNMRFMPPSVALRKQDADTLVTWILGLN